MIRNKISCLRHATAINKMLFVLIFSAGGIMNNVVFALPSYKHFSDYINIKPTQHSDPVGLRIHYTAKQKVNDRNHDPLYKNNKWKLVLRHGLYLAQVDKAMSEIYQYFLGYSTDVDIVDDNGDYYIARRKFKKFRKAYDPTKSLAYVLHKEGKTFYVNDYVLQDDGRLINGDKVKRFKGLASMAVLTSFFGEADTIDDNYGYHVSDQDIKPIFFDCENALDFFEGPDEEVSDVETDLINQYGHELVDMTWYQQEKKQMLEKIAATDFTVMETFIRNNITASRLDEARWMLNKIINDPNVLPDYDRHQARIELDEINKLDDKDYSIEQVISELRKRHEALRRELAEKK